MGAIGILELRRRRNFIHAAMREALPLRLSNVASGVLTLPTAAPPRDDDRALGRGAPPRAHGGSRAAPRSRPRQHRLLFAQGVHPADAALPRHLPLLHLRARPARGRIGLSLAGRGAGDRARGRAMPAARRRCSRSATSRSCKYEAARRALARLGYETTIDYLAAMCALVLRETGLLPHVNPGVMSEADIAALRRVSVSQGMMLENVSPRLVRARRAASRLARQGAGGAARHHRGGRASSRCRSPPAS